MTKEKNEDVLKYQFFAQQLQTIEQQTQILHQQIEELQELQRSLEEFKKAKKGDKMYSLLGPGVFVEGIVDDTSVVHISVGAETLVKKTIQEAKEITAKQIKDLENVDKELHSQAESIMKELENLEKQKK